MSIVQTKHWHQLDDGRIQCDLCPRYCKMREGQRGLCYVRGVENGEVVLTSYGMASGFCIDPIEKKPLNHFLPGTPVLSFGQFGCNLTCSFCQNWSISKAQRDNPRKHGIELLDAEWERKHTTNTQLDLGGKNSKKTAASSTCNLSQNWDISKSRELDKLQAKASPELIAEAALQSGCKSVAFTYNDPVIFLEYAVDVAQACHERGIKTVAVSAGYICPNPRAEFYQHMDAANIDLKAFTEEFYMDLCSSHLANVLETLVYLKHETDVWFEITTLLIPGENDSDQELNEECAWIAENLGNDVPLHFSAFHPDWKMRDKPNTPPETLMRARKIAQDHGLRYVYLGNIHSHEGSSTYCHNCGDILIGRDWYELSDWGLGQGGHCISCGTACAGVFEPKPGTWGRKRQPVRLGG